MRILLALLLAGCVTKTDIERQIGNGARCVRASGDGLMCTTRSGKNFICYIAAATGDDFTLCFEAVDARDIGE
jgi:hypothetical protein